MTVTDAEATAELGPKCPDCGWRRDAHSPGGLYLGPPCPRYTSNDTEESA